MKFSLLIVSIFVLCLGIEAAAGSARAQWLDSSQIKVKLPAGLYISSSSTQFALVDSSTSLREGAAIPLPLLSSSGSYAHLGTAHLSKEEIGQLLSLPLKVVVTNNNRQILDATSIQFAGVLDHLFSYEGSDLGAQCSRTGCSLKLWAPTAKNVRVLLFNESAQPLEQARVLQATPEDQGVWSLKLPTTAINAYYLYEVQVYQPLADKIETALVTDPYSFSLSMNGTRSQIADLNSLESMPQGWQKIRKPELKSLKESIIYELHVRDFSANDETMPAAYRGTYLAFTQLQSAGVRHLASLAQAGLTHIHLLPFNDYGSVDEDRESWETYLGPGTNLQEPQSVIGGIRTTDSYNWGYDPVHYFAPEGSYATQPDGVHRVLEARAMVLALNELGLRVVQDVVFNHTYQNGYDRYSVFDKIVPLYYYRVDEEGKVFNTSCCPDTASENVMMEKLMIDTVLHWARTYKLDGFRFDLMSFHSKSTMAKIRDELRSLTLAHDGVDGSKILLYGEGWNFGSFYDKNAQEAMTMDNSHGMGFGFFNDRLRDAVRGGTTNSYEKSDQGFATGLFFDFNHEPANRNTPSDLNSQRGRLLHFGDVIKVGLAGNLRDYPLREHLGQVIYSGDLLFRGAPVAFAAEALETINYVSAHDGYGVWDAIQAKAPFYSYGRTPAIASLEDRQRMQQLIMALPLLGQGIPFIEAGTELLRSKNGDQDSYDSGEFFNRIDWTGRQNYWGEGLPPAWKNLNDWSFWQPRLQEPRLKPTAAHIEQTNKYFQALLRVRQSSSLFHLNTLEEMKSHLVFIDNDSQPEPGLIAMLMHNKEEALLIFFNASREARIFSHKVLSYNWFINPLFNHEVDPILHQVVLSPLQKSIQIPGRTTIILKMNVPKRSKQ
ncbi:Pullulanase precursor [compost metagenome]